MSQLTDINFDKAPEAQPVDIYLAVVFHADRNTKYCTGHYQNSGREHAE
jgi:hypothetical protein